MVITITHYHHYGDRNYKIVAVHLAGWCPCGKINHVKSVRTSKHTCNRLCNDQAKMQVI